MSKQEILEILSCNESAVEGTTTTLDPPTRKLTGSSSEAEEVVENSSASPKATSKAVQSTKKPPASVPVLMKEASETSSGDVESREKVTDIPIGDSGSGNESSSLDEEEEEEQTETSEEPPDRFGNTRVAGASKVETTKRKREEEDRDGSGSMGDDESGESDASAGLSLKKKRKPTAKEEVVPALTPPPTPKKPKAKKDVKGSEGKDGVADVEDTGANEGGARGGPQPKPKSGGKGKKEASTIAVKASSPSHAKSRSLTGKTIEKDPKARGHAGVTPRRQKESVEGSITAGEIGIIFETLSAEADWAAVVAKTNALVGLKRLGRNVSRHWKTIAKKKLLDAYGA